MRGLFTTNLFKRKTQPGTLRMQDHLAHRLASGEHFQCIGGLRQGERAVDMRGDFSFRRPLNEQTADALKVLAGRKAMGKVILHP